MSTASEPVESREAELARPLILSASRTRDMVHRSPEVLEAVLAGRQRARWGPYAPEGWVKPEALHTVVLWTKAPNNLLAHAGLRRVLERLATRHGVGLALQLTVTGLGGSFLEPGIPTWREVVAVTARLLEEPWMDVRALTLRFDPFLVVETPAGRLFGNLDPAVFRATLEPFLEMGVGRIVTSRGDAVRYPRVAERMRAAGLRWRQLEDSVAESFCRALDAWCRARGVAFTVCCELPVPGLVNRWGCIDAHHLNAVFREAPPSTTWLHNRLGKQRPSCRCTYSKDIGYTTGAARCFSGGFGCLYCYAQGRARIPDASRLREDVLEFDRSPPAYLERRGMHRAMWLQDGLPGADMAC